MCASAPRSDILIFGRALLGLGASGLLQGALAIIGYVVPLEKVPLFQGIVISAVGISIFIGPIIGGTLTEYATWRKFPVFLVLILSPEFNYDLTPDIEMIHRLVFLDVRDPIF